MKQKKRLFNFPVLIIAVCMMFTITGCASEQKDAAAESNITESEIRQDQTDGDTMIEIINEVSEIRGKDIIDGQYETPLQFSLNEKEVETLKGSLQDATLQSGRQGIKKYYRLMPEDDNGNLIDEWIVDTSGQLHISGKTVVDDGSLREWLRQMEAAHDITYETVFDRKPGPHYFDAMKEADHAELNEITENNFTEGIEYKIPEATFEKLRAFATDVNVIGEGQQPSDLEFVITVFDEKNAELYTIEYSKDGKAYCYGWELESKELYSWLDEVRSDSGLMEKAK